MNSIANMSSLSSKALVILSSKLFSSLSLKYQQDSKVPDELKKTDYLYPRHIGLNEKEIAVMLKEFNCKTLDDLMLQIIPKNIYDKTSLSHKEGDAYLDPPLTESDFLQSIKSIMSKNKHHKFYLGQGYSNTLTPTVLVRSLIENPVWYTSYTPYQAEISQGRLESLLNFQTLTTELTGLPVANSSLLDEGTAAAEAMLLCYAEHKQKRKLFFVSKNIFPQTVQVLQTRAKFLGIQLVIDDPFTFDFASNSQNLCGAIFQNPDNFGLIHDYSPILQEIKKNKCVTILATDFLALTLMKESKAMGFDVAIGSSGRFGVPIGYGGPHAAFFATEKKYMRKMPGRIVGATKDNAGDYALRLALQAREQHIKREKALSNICTAQALVANVAVMYAIYHGPEGLKKIATRVNDLTQIFAYAAGQLGYQIMGANKEGCNFFDTVSIQLQTNTSLEMATKFLEHNINIRRVTHNIISFSFDETTSIEDIAELVKILCQISGKDIDIDKLFYDAKKICKPLVKQIQRKSKYMQQKIFQDYQTESKMLRYIHMLQDKDISLSKSMIPLGSCTMKCNPTTTLIPFSLAEMNVHPMVPLDQAAGYHEMFQKLDDWLRAITKFDSYSFQPNSGAAGEYAGLLTIRNYLEATGQSHRNICLIPVSAHGTNPASAFVSGMKIVHVETTERGEINLKDLEKKAKQHTKNLAAIMITYPSTYGVYEGTVVQAIDIVHKYGGQVYMDGANMNAQVGYTSPGFLGADVGHLNLHKTFSSPHGGGGPGMGPIGCKKHLAPYLPKHLYHHEVVNRLDPELQEKHFSAVASAPYGSGSLVSIAYCYIALLGKNVRNVTAIAILNANYLKKKLQKYYPILYQDAKGFVAHEFIMDCRQIKEKTGISEEDIAKRLMDFGFHAPTVSFPVPGTLMVEPTESEDKDELDRFTEAMIQIRKEIQMVEDGIYPKLDNPLKNAPHTQKFVYQEEWKHPYTRIQAAFPLKWIHDRGKLWPMVGRVDGTYGDRNLVCTAPK